MSEIQVGDDIFFMFKDKIREARVLEKTTIESYSDIFGKKKPQIKYEINSNPAGSQYTKIFHEGELFSSKQSLIDSL